MIKLKQLEDYAERIVSETDTQLKKFGSNISSDANRPYVLEWSLGYFEEAAKNFVCKKILSAKNNRGETNEQAVVDAIANYALTEVINGARWPKRSTSPVDHLMHECLTAQWANLYCFITDRM